MVTTYSGIVVITGIEDFSVTSSFPIISFDSATDRQDGIGYSGRNFHSEIDLFTTDVFFTGGMMAAITFDSATSRLDSVPYSGKNVHSEISVINPIRDYRYTVPTAASGIIVVDYGFDINFGYIAIPRINARLYPTPVSTATLFPGDKPRGQPLN